MAACSMLLAALTATAPGSELFDRSTPAFRVFAAAAATALYKPSDPDTLWVGTENGLLRLRGGAWTLFDHAAGMPNDRVRSLLETRGRDGARRLWVGTQEGGLATLTGERIRRVE